MGGFEEAKPLLAPRGYPSRGTRVAEAVRKSDPIPPARQGKEGRRDARASRTRLTPTPGLPNAPPPPPTLGDPSSPFAPCAAGRRLAWTIETQMDAAFDHTVNDTQVASAGQPTTIDATGQVLESIASAVSIVVGILSG